MSKDPRQEGEIIELILPAVILTIIFSALWVIIDGDGLILSDGVFVDPDVYSWLLRVEALQEGQDWFDHRLYRINPPDGHLQHWTRPLDGLMWLGGLLLAPLFGFRDGLALWANIISPLLLVLLLWPMWKLARFLLNREEAAWALGAFAVYRGTLEAFQWGRADHHSLLVGGQVLFFFAFATVFLQEKNRLRNAFLCGLFGAFAIWVNLEALFYVLVGLAALGLYWLWGNRDLLKAAIAMSAGLALGMAVATLIEWGPYVFELHPVDTISVIYVVLFMLTTGFWAGLWAVDGRRERPLGFLPRAALAAGLAALVLGGIYLMSPEIFRGPFHMVEDLYRGTRLKSIGEQWPMLVFEDKTFLEVFGRALTFLYLLPAAVWVSWKKVKSELPEKEKWLWATMGAMALVCALLAQFHAVRWIVYMTVGAAFGYGVLCHMAYQWLKERTPGALNAAIRPVTIFLLLFSPMLLGIVLINDGAEKGIELESGHGEATQALGYIEDCDVRGAAVVLNDQELFPEPSLLLVDPTHGSEFLYRTDHFVLSMANHRPQPGFRLFVETMRERDVAVGHQRLVERGVDAVLLCVLDFSHATIWGAEPLEGQPPSLMESLMHGAKVDGFSLVADPFEGGGWWIYRVEPGSSS